MPASDQKANFDRYMLIPRVLIFLRRGERWLLIRGAADKRLWAGKYNGLGGHIEPGEDPLSAARRELNEETGLQAETLRLCGVAAIDTQNNPGVGLYIFYGTSSQGQLQPSAEGELEWLSTAELAGRPLVEDLPLLLERLERIARNPAEPPFSLSYHYNAQGSLQIHEGE